jgi:hypothetical protein
VCVRVCVCVTFRSIVDSYGEGVLSLRHPPPPTAGEPPFVGCPRLLIQDMPFTSESHLLHFQKLTYKQFIFVEIVESFAFPVEDSDNPLAYSVFIVSSPSSHVSGYCVQCFKHIGYFYFQNRPILLYHNLKLHTVFSTCYMRGTDRVADRRTNICTEKRETERDSYQVIERPYAGFHQALLYYCT